MFPIKVDKVYILESLIYKIHLRDTLPVLSLKCNFVSKQ